MDKRQVLLLCHFQEKFAKDISRELKIDSDNLEPRWPIALSPEFKMLYQERLELDAKDILGKENVDQMMNTAASYHECILALGASEYIYAQSTNERLALLEKSLDAAGKSFAMNFYLLFYLRYINITLIGQKILAKLVEIGSFEDWFVVCHSENEKRLLVDNDLYNFAVSAAAKALNIPQGGPK